MKLGVLVYRVICEHSMPAWVDAKGDEIFKNTLNGAGVADRSDNSKVSIFQRLYLYRRNKYALPYGTVAANSNTDTTSFKRISRDLCSDAVSGTLTSSASCWQLGQPCSGVSLQTCGGSPEPITLAWSPAGFGGSRGSCHENTSQSES